MNHDQNIGWICPKCGRVYAPTVKECPNCNPKQAQETVDVRICKNPQMICS